MKIKKYCLKAGKAGFVSNTVLLMALTGCVYCANGQDVRISVTPPVVVTPEVTVDNYVYYPSYGVYYNTTRRQFCYRVGDAWVTRPQPPGVSADVLLALPSVKMDFHDSPDHHHADVVRKYPKNYKAARPDHPDQKVESRDAHDGHDGHDQRDGK
jgi:hypothetical protein